MISDASCHSREISIIRIIRALAVTPLLIETGKAHTLAIVESLLSVAGWLELDLYEDSTEWG